MRQLAKVRDTGIVGTIAVTLPRPGPVGKGRAVVALRAGTVALHAGESPEIAEAFAAAVLASWEARHAAELARPRPRVTRAARAIAAGQANDRARRAAIAAMTPAEREAANAAAYAGAVAA